MSQPLHPKQISFLRSRAHPLEPRVSLGKKGPDEAFHALLEAALGASELVKVRVGRLVDADLAAVAAARGAVLVGQVGRNAVFYRPADPPQLRLPEAPARVEAAEGDG